MYRLFLPYTSVIHATRVYKRIRDGDAFLDKDTFQHFRVCDRTDFKWCPVEECTYKFETYQVVSMIT